MTARNDIFDALLALGAAAQWSGGGFKSATRKFRDFSDFPSEQQPVLIQIEHKETIVQKTGLPYRRTFDVIWAVYFKSDPSDPESIGSAVMNDIIDALETALIPSGPEETQTLGNRVHHCFISGAVTKASGDIGGQGVIEIPIQILGP